MIAAVTRSRFTDRSKATGGCLHGVCSVVCTSARSRIIARTFSMASLRPTIQAVTQHLIKHFPLIGDDGNELPDKPVVL